jgi:NAD(P)-dependent dehydrogenase (short-subunit alcohol dehydrogenase family)
VTTTKTLESTVQPTKDQVTASAVLITGALTGIGRATALAFAREGARIVVSGRHDAREDVKIWFDAFDRDDFVSFGGKP